MSSIFHRELSSGEEVVPEEHEVLLLVALALRLQPGQDALGGVPAAQVHLEDQDQDLAKLEKVFYSTSSPPTWNVVGLNISSQSLKKLK